MFQGRHLFLLLLLSACFPSFLRSKIQCSLLSEAGSIVSSVTDKVLLDYSVYRDVHKYIVTVESGCRLDLIEKYIASVKTNVISIALERCS